MKQGTHLLPSPPRLLVSICGRSLHPSKPTVLRFAFLPSFLPLLSDCVHVHKLRKNG